MYVNGQNKKTPFNVFENQQYKSQLPCTEPFKFQNKMCIPKK